MKIESMKLESSDRKFLITQYGKMPKFSGFFPPFSTREFTRGVPQK